VFAHLALLLSTIAPCKGRSGLRVYVEPDAVRPRDTVMSARVCLTVPERGTRVASLSGRVSIDTAFARIASVDRPARSPLFVRDNGDGAVLIAGAAPQGFRSGVLFTMRAALARPGVVPRIDVKLTELNESSGQSLVTTATVSGLAPRCAGTRTAVFEVLPAQMSADSGEPLDLRITGCGFADRNIVHFGEMTLKDIRSTDDGTRIRVVIPREYRATSEAAPMQLSAGAYDITIDNGRGPSNARRVTLR
jgi:hypothetical protein